MWLGHGVGTGRGQGWAGRRGWPGWAAGWMVASGQIFTAPSYHGAGRAAAAGRTTPRRAQQSHWSPSLYKQQTLECPECSHWTLEKMSTKYSFHIIQRWCLVLALAGAFFQYCENYSKIPPPCLPCTRQRPQVWDM